MPLPLAFTSSNLHSIKEADEEVPLEEDNAEEEDFLARVRIRASQNNSRSRSLSNTASKSSRAEDNYSRTSERRKGGSKSSLSASSTLSASSSLSAISSRPSNDTSVLLSELSYLRSSVNQLLEAQQQQQVDAKAAEERNNNILQLLEASKDQFANVCESIQNLQAAVANVKPLEDSLRLLSDEVKSSNAECREALTSLNVSSEPLYSL